MSERVLFRTAAGPSVGGGHVYRCIALARAVEALGAETDFAVNETARDLVPVLPENARIVEAGNGTQPISDTAAEIDAMLDGASGAPDWAVVDHYRRDAVYEAALQARGIKVLAIDDLTRPHAAEIVTDPAPHRLEDAYRDAAPNALRLLGSAFAPLRRDFADAAPAPGRDGAVLIAFGAADPLGTSAEVLDAIAARPDCLGARKLIALIGAGSRHRAATEAAARAAGAEIRTDVRDMAALLGETALAIGAGGVGALERCCMAVPSLLIEIAANQRATIDALTDAGAAAEVPLPAIRERLPDQIAALLSDARRRTEMARAARRVCDGKGAARLAEAMLDPATDRDGVPVMCRPAGREDAARLFAWQTEPGARRFSRNPEPPSWEAHCVWLDRILGDPDRLLTIVERPGGAAGMVRLDRQEDGAFEVSILIGTAAAGRGVGRAALRAVERESARFFGVAAPRLLAYVQPENAASLRLFAAAGYQPLAGRLGWHIRSTETAR